MRIRFGIAVFVVVAGAATLDLPLPLPSLPVLVGMPLRAQAVAFDGASLQLSNVLHELKQ